MVLSLSAVLFLTGVTAMSTLGSYIAIYVQQNANFIAWNTLAQTVAIFIVGPLVPTIVRTIGKRTGYQLMACVGLIGALLLGFSPLSEYPILGPVAFFFLGLAINGVNTLMWALEADCVEYGEWQTGQRTEGTTYAVFSFTRKMGQALGGFVGGLALTWAGFSATAASSGQQQADGVAQNIQLWTGGLLATAFVLALVVMILYPLTEQKFQQIMTDISARRGAAD